MTSPHNTSWISRWKSRRAARSLERDGGEADQAAVIREAESVLIAELQDSSTPAEVLQDAADELESTPNHAPGSRFRLTRAQVASAGSVALVVLAAVARRSRRSR